MDPLTAQGIRSQEEQLFAEWQIKGTKFVKDGAAEAAAYIESSPRLVFVLKEINGDDSDVPDLREFVRDGGRPATWNNITRWTRGVRCLERDIPWHDLREVSEELRQHTLASIVAMNLNKTGGGGSTDREKLKGDARQGRDFFKRQFSIYRPEVVICCGTWDLFHESVQLTDSEWMRTGRDVRYLKNASGMIVVDYFHPQARMSASMLHYTLMDALREIIG